MSTIISPKSKNCVKILKIPQDVIVKGFKGEPKVLKCIGIENFHFIIVGNNEKTQIRLKNKYVYCYSKKMFERLKNLFESGDFNLLVKEWEQAQPYDIPESEG